MKKLPEQSRYPLLSSFCLTAWLTHTPDVKTNSTAAVATGVFCIVVENAVSAFSASFRRMNVRLLILF